MLVLATPGAKAENLNKMATLDVEDESILSTIFRDSFPGKENVQTREFSERERNASDVVELQ